MDPARYTVLLFQRWRKWNSPWRTKKERLGAEGEKMAACYLKKHGFRILYRNFRSPSGGEIDLVCRDRQAACLVFVEVKRRQSNRFGAPSLAVHTEKQYLLVRGASAWLRLLGNPEVVCRFDIVEIIDEGPTNIRHIRDAFPVPPNIYGI